MSCASPTDAPSRHALHGVDVVCIGRGFARRALREEDRGAVTLTLELNDPHVSSAHARISRRGDGWFFEDLGSKNGSFVNGAPIVAARLPEGECLQIGQTLLILRTGLPTPSNAARDLVATAQTPVLATLLPTLARELDVLATMATSRAPVLLCSETGTGKELLARAVHDLSRRKGGFIPVNCGGLPRTLFESTLFGHKRGAFSGAVADHPGLFRAAQNGTLMLDEVGDMPLDVQSAVLRALQDGNVLAVGATQPVHVDARVVSATHWDLEAAVASGRFREDLLARLAGHVFRLPPLRERREDIGLLTGALLRTIAAERGTIPRLRPETGLALMRHAWPRNVRQLEKCLVYATALASDGIVGPEHLPEDIGSIGRSPLSADDQLRLRLTRLLAENAGNISLVAAALRTSRSQVHRWIKKFSIRVTMFRR